MQPTDQTSTVVVSMGFGDGDKQEHTGFGVALEAQHDLWSAIPSCRNVFRHVSCILLRVDREATGQTKITDLELAVGIDEQVSALQVSVQHIGGVDILQTAEDLVDEGLEMRIGQRLSGADNSRQVTFHQFYSGGQTIGRSRQGEGEGRTQSITYPRINMSR